MIPRQCLVNKLRDLGYVFVERTKRTELYRKKGGTHNVKAAGVSPIIVTVFLFYRSPRLTESEHSVMGRGQEFYSSNIPDDGSRERSPLPKHSQSG